MSPALSFSYSDSGTALLRRLSLSCVSPLHCLFNGRQQVAILLEGRILGIVRLICSVVRNRKPALLAGSSQIVVAVAGGDGIVAHGLEGPDGGELG